jgi:hypothetical protein
MEDEVSEKFYGKYRGTVVNNVDPLQLGRIQALVPDVFGLTPCSWACPACRLPVSNKALRLATNRLRGMDRVRTGEPDYPIWVGGFWGVVAEVPALALAPPPIPPGQNIVVQTTLQNTLIISDATPTPASGGIVLKSTTGATIVVNYSGVYIQNGKGASILMTGTAVPITGAPVTINNGA